MKFRRLKNIEFERVEALAKAQGISLDTCPTCGSTPFTVVAAKGHEVEGATAEGRISGTYRLDGETHECDCETQMRLRRYYLADGIPDQYIRLNWDDYDGSDDVRFSVDLYLNHWPSMRRNGMGLEFFGTTLGVGKTFGATHVAKELIKRGVRTHFIPFLTMIRLTGRMMFENDPLAHDEWAKLLGVNLLVLDELRPYNENQAFFADRFEELVRHRTDWNLPTIITTNLTQEELLELYPRPYSLLEAKQNRIEVHGNDNRRGKIAKINMDRAINDEIPPIT
jgi:DNA replication protein DnaC